MAGAATVLRRRIAAFQAGAQAPVLVAVDGRSGTGKSTLAQRVGAQVAVLVLDAS